MLRGFATVNYWADDMEAAKSWYAELLGVEAYFEIPGYAEFRIGDYQHELGLNDRRDSLAGSASSPGGVVLYWHVDDIEAAFKRLVSMGAKEHETITPHGDQGVVTASVVDPFGNILGIMVNPHYLEVLASSKKE